MGQVDVELVGGPFCGAVRQLPVPLPPGMRMHGVPSGRIYLYLFDEARSRDGDLRYRFEVELTEPDPTPPWPTP